MIKSITTLRVRYSETDQMKYVYYGHYLTYFEVARTEFIRQFFVPYKVLEEQYGVMLPVREAAIRYYKPLKYDDLITIQTTVNPIPERSRVTFEHEVYTEDGTLAATGKVELVFVSLETMRPCKPPQDFVNAMLNAVKHE